MKSEDAVIWQVVWSADPRHSLFEKSCHIMLIPLFVIILTFSSALGNGIQHYKPEYEVGEACHQSYPDYEGFYSPLTQTPGSIPPVTTDWPTNVPFWPQLR